MDFRTEFFPLLNKALFKENNNITEDIVTNSDIFLFDRYTSFYHPKLVELINSTMNKFSKSITFDESGPYLYQVLKTILPTLNKSYIPYISKKKSNLISKADTFVKTYSRKNNISEREVWGMLYLYEEINK